MVKYGEAFLKVLLGGHGGFYLALIASFPRENQRENPECDEVIRRQHTTTAWQSDFIKCI